MSGGPVVFVNPGSGPKETAVDELEDAFGDVARVSVTSGSGLSADVARAIDAGAPWVGVAGGDGSLRTAAPVLAAAARPMLAVPCGTKNHFARAVGIDDLAASVRAAAEGDERKVDIAWVNGHCFLNTANLGLYAAIAKERVRHHELPKRVADALGIAKQAFSGHRLRVCLDDKGPVASWAIFVGNGVYGDTLGDMGQRDAMDDGDLDVRVVRADQRLARLRLLGAMASGRLHRTPVVDRTNPSELVIGIPGHAMADVALDGDVTRLRTPLRWHVDHQALTVRVPQGGPTA